MGAAELCGMGLEESWGAQGELLVPSSWFQRNREESWGVGIVPRVEVPRKNRTWLRARELTSKEV